MTKLLEWLLLISVFFGIWLAAVAGSSTLVEDWQEIIFFLPIIFLFFFSLYAAITVLYRVFTFNTCKNAAIELQQQIEEARKDLQNKGVTLTRKNNISSSS